MSTKQSIILITAILVGFLGVNQFSSYQQAREARSRDTNVSYVNQLNLIVKTNENLKGELANIDQQLTEFRTTANVYQVLQKDIERFRKLTGKDQITGPGVTISIDTKIETYWLIDIVNELYVSGAEAISVNDKRVSQRVGFVSQGDTDLTIYLNNQSPLVRPYTIRAIGDSNLLYQYLTQNDGIVRRLRNALGANEQLVTIEKNENIVIPATPVQNAPSS